MHMRAIALPTVVVAVLLAGCDSEAGNSSNSSSKRGHTDGSAATATPYIPESKRITPAKLAQVMPACAVLPVKDYEDTLGLKLPGKPEADEPKEAPVNQRRCDYAIDEVSVVTTNKWYWADVAHATLFFNESEPRQTFNQPGWDPQIKLRKAIGDKSKLYLVQYKKDKSGADGIIVAMPGKLVVVKFPATSTDEECVELGEKITTSLDRWSSPIK